MENLDFNYSQEQLKNIANQVLEKAYILGATNAQVEINEGIDTSVDILNDNIENFSTSYDVSLILTVYIGNQRGSVGISKISLDNIDEFINKALDIAKYTQPDLANGLPEIDLLCKSFTENLNLYNPIKLDNKYLIEKASAIEAFALTQDARLSSDGVSIGISKYNFILANTHGLSLGYKTTRFDESISLIGKNTYGMQTDSWYTSNRNFNHLLPDEQLANIAVSRVIRRLKPGKIKSGNYPVIFENSIAKSLIGNFLGAISGNNLYRKLSFLNNSIDTKIFPDWLKITDDPFITNGLASCYFDNEGVNVHKRNLVEDGTIQGYLLSSYSARKLKMLSTGNAGGNHNIIVKHNFSGDTLSLAKEMHNGLIIIETIGHGVNMVNGDYSVGASGLWVENGEIQFFVENITISGNLKSIYKNIRYINNDIYNGSILCGAILVNHINISV